MIASTGHEYNNRHSCKDGMFIRTTFLKDIEWDLSDKKNFSHPEGNVKFGAGIVFAEAHKSAADNNRVISSGWASTVGVVGWAIGGGHGPFSPSLGLGSDNILEADIITGDGKLLTVNATHNSDLFWAIRGGGGSTWGIFTSITFKAYNIPNGGFTLTNMTFVGNFCNDSLNDLNNLIGNHT
jgi:ribonuclease T2